MIPALQKRSSRTPGLRPDTVARVFAALAITGALLIPLAAEGAPRRARSHAKAAVRDDRSSAPHARQARRLEQAKAAIARLRGDARRRRYRDGWEAIARSLDRAVKADPTGPRAAEAALWAAKARAELWNVSRSRRDAASAVSAYLAVDDKFAGSDAAAQALPAAIVLAVHVKHGHDAARAAGRLAAYPRTPEAVAALALARESAGEAAPVAPRLAPADAAPARAARAADRAAQKPVDPDAEDDDGDHPAAAPAASKPRPAAPVAVRASRAGRDAPASPAREPDTDVPAEAARILDDLVKATRGAANATVASGAAALAAARSDADHAAAPAGGAGAVADGAVHDDAAVPRENQAKSGESDSAASLAGAGDAESQVSGDEAEPPEPEAPEALPARPGRSAAKVARKLSPDDEETEAEAEQKARALRRTALSSQADSVAAQLGLKVRKVVIDPGHGGKDAGAIGPHGLREKDVSLKIAKKLATRLRAQGLTVVLTRDTDVFVPLDDRTRIANDARADLFVSIHCNAAKKRNLSGVETWTLNVASDRYAARLAAFENAEDEHSVSDLRLILADLATKANTTDARELAGSVQSSLVRNLRARVGSVRDNGVKQALFYVLLGTHMPSILVETAFLSNPEEEKRLRSVRYQEGTADAIARGVREFLDGRQKLARVP